MKVSDHLRGRFARATLLVALAAAAIARASEDGDKTQTSQPIPTRSIPRASRASRRGPAHPASTA
jgi:hypothetical protein